MSQRTKDQERRNGARIVLMLAVAWLMAAAGVMAQDEADSARKEPDRPTLQGSAGLGGFGAMAPGQWGLVQAQLRNATDSEQKMRLVFSFTRFPQRQFVREAAMPARSSRSVSMPARAGSLPDGAQSTDTEILLFPIGQDLEMGRAPGSALVWQGRLTFAIVGDTGGDASQQERIGRIDEEADDVLTAVRKQAGEEQERQAREQGEAEESEDEESEDGVRKRRKDSAKLYPTVATTPRFDTAWDVAYLLAITADKPNFDAAQRRALRRWVARGGILVVFLDQVDNQRMHEIIGEAWTIEEIDRLSLTTVKFQDVPGGSTKSTYDLGAEGGELHAQMSTEDPVAFTRVIAPDWNRHLDVNNWPALLSKRLGRGMLVAVTVGGRAWTVPELRSDDKKEVIDPGTLAALDRLAGLIMPVDTQQSTARAQPADVFTSEAGRDFLTRLIGYEVIDRKWVALVMLVFLGLFVVAGIYWHKRGVGERLGLAAVVLSVIASGVLVVLGFKQRGEIPPSAASLQLAQVQPGLSSVRVSGPAGLYYPEQIDVTLKGNGGGWIWPVETREEGDLQRMRTDDLDRWTWTNLGLSAGVPRPLDVSVDLEVARPFVSDMRFTDKGLQGTVNFPIDSATEDLLVATPHANLEPKIETVEGEEGEGAKSVLTIGPEQVLPEGVFYTGTPHEDRAALLGSLFRVSRFDVPSLLGWSGGLDLQYDIEAEDSDNKPIVFEREETTLWAAPIQVQRSKPGDTVVIPWPLIPMQNVRMTESQERLGFSLMPMYRPQGQLEDSDNDLKPDRLVYWIAGNNPSAFIGRFMIPPQVLPIELTGATVHLNIQAIGRNVKLFALKGEEAIELAELIGPDGENAVPVPADKLTDLVVDGGGGVLIGFDVQSPGDGDSSSRATGLDMWQVRYFGLEVAGKVGAPKP